MIEINNEQTKKDLIKNISVETMPELQLNKKKMKMYPQLFKI